MKAKDIGKVNELVRPWHLNQGCEYNEQLGADADGCTLLDYLSHRYCHSSSEEWTARIQCGQVLIDGLPTHPDTLLRRGSRLLWHRPPWIEPDAPKSFSIIYEDDDLIAVNKPAGLPTLPGANFLQSTLLYLVQIHAPAATPLHRLGRWTSGIVLCAKNQAARAELMRQWSAKKVDKLYRALASGAPDWDELEISTPIGPVPHPLLGTIHAATPKGKPSLSHATVIERRADSFLCDVRIATGRPHQIRIHLASAGHPLLGDPLYGPGGHPLAGTRAVPGDSGYHLHAMELGFLHPVSGQKMIIHCGPPASLVASTETPAIHTRGPEIENGE